MPNNLTSNIMTKVVKGLAKGFEAQQVLTKTVNTSMISNEFDASTGDTIFLKRFNEARAVESVDGDITGLTSSITSGRARAVVQPYITTFASWTNREQMLFLEDQDEYMKPYAERLVTQLELNLAAFIQKNAGLLVGTPGTAVTKWSDVAAANSLMEAMGVPVLDNNAYYVMTPFVRQRLADLQSGLASGDNDLVNQAWKKALISKDFGGIQALSSNALKNYTSGASVARTGTVSITPDSTYVTAKDSMTQTIVLTGLTASTANAVRAGDLIRITQANRTRLNPHTQQVIYDGAGLPKQWTYVVLVGGNTDGAGTVSITVSAAAINETDGAYNNIASAILSGDTFALLGATNAVYTPNLFYHKNAFVMTTIKPPKLEGGVETAYITKGGLNIRATMYANGDANTQKMRMDIVPVFGVMNPLWAGNAFGE